MVLLARGQEVFFYQVKSRASEETPLLSKDVQKGTVSLIDTRVENGSGWQEWVSTG